MTPDRYPAPRKADLVTWWVKDGKTVMSVVCEGVVTDYEVPLSVLEGAGRRALEALLVAATR